MEGLGDGGGRIQKFRAVFAPNECARFEGLHHALAREVGLVADPRRELAQEQPRLCALSARDDVPKFGWHRLGHNLQAALSAHAQLGVELLELVRGQGQKA